MIYFLLCLSHSIEKVLISFNQEKKKYLFRSLVSVGRFDLSAPSYLIPSEVELSFWSDNELLCSIEVLLNSTRTTSPDSVGEVWIQINPNFKLGIESICKCRHGMILVFGCRSLSSAHLMLQVVRENHYFKCQLNVTRKSDPNQILMNCLQLSSGSSKKHSVE